MWDGYLEKTNTVRHHVNLKSDYCPAFPQPYLAGLTAKKHESQETEGLLREDVIEPAISEWASPVVFATKKGGNLRFCVDYRRLTAMTVPDTYQLSRVYERIDSLGDATVFSAIDCSNGHWWIEIPEAERDKSTFSSHHGLIRVVRMPFRLRSAPASFQRAVETIPSRVQ